MAATVDSEEQLEDIANNLSIPVAWGVTEDQAESIGAWWEPRRNHIQPSEFVLSATGKVIMSTYSNSPIGRMDPAETLSLIRYLNEQRARAKAEAEQSAPA